MIYQMYAVLDATSKTFQKPMFAINDGIMIRQLTDLFRSEVSNPIVLHPGDFALYRIAQYNDISAEVTAEQVPVKIMTGTEAQAQSAAQMLDESKAYGLNVAVHKAVMERVDELIKDVELKEED